MPLHELAVTQADVSGARLGLALNAPAPTTLATCRLEHPGGGTLELGILGASHVITVEHDTARFSEEVSCNAQSSGRALPGDTNGPGYHLQSRITTENEAGFRALANWLRQYCVGESGWLGGVFPGDTAALTALNAEPDGDGWQWRTWHLYPEGRGGTVVYTSSRWHP